MNQPSTPAGAPQKSSSTDPTFEELEHKTEELKEKIDEQRRKHDMPINSSLGNPDIDADNADGHNDVPDDPEE